MCLSLIYSQLNDLTIALNFVYTLLGVQITRNHYKKRAGVQVTKVETIVTENDNINLLYHNSIK